MLIKTGFNEAFIIDGKKKDELIAKDPKNAEIIKPILRGRDIKRYKVEFADLWLIATFPSLHININEYPAVKEYLQAFGKRLEQTGEKGCRKKTNHKWFEVQDNIAYHKEFEKEKIVYREISTTMDAWFDSDGFYVNNKLYIVTGENLKFLIAILNTVIFSNFILKQANITGGKGVDFLGDIPVPRISPSAQQPFIPLVNQILSLKKSSPNADTSTLEAEIDQMVYKLYGLTPKEIEIVENSFNK